MKSRQVPFLLYWRVENVQFWINSIGHLGWLSCISNFPRFHKNVNSLKLWKYISENSSPKGSFWRNKKKSEFSELSWDSPYLLAVALKFLRHSCLDGKVFAFSEWNRRFLIVDGAYANAIALVFIFLAWAETTTATETRTSPNKGLMSRAIAVQIIADLVLYIFFEQCEPRPRPG